MTKAVGHTSVERRPPAYSERPRPHTSGPTQIDEYWKEIQLRNPVSNSDQWLKKKIKVKARFIEFSCPPYRKEREFGG